jgi:hypothetical protein
MTEAIVVRFKRLTGSTEDIAFHFFRRRSYFPSMKLLAASLIQMLARMKENATIELSRNATNL